MNASFSCLSICTLVALLVEALESVLISSTNTVSHLDLSYGLKWASSQSTGFGLRHNLVQS